MAIWREETYGTGRCINCGFLGKRPTDSAVSECYEATAVERDSGTLTSKEGYVYTRPWCFIDKVRFYEELEALGTSAGDSQKVRDLLEYDRKCDPWYRWREFVSPKEHYEEYMMLQTENSRKEFEQTMESKRQEFELRLEELNKEERKRTNTIMIWLAIAAIMFAFAEVMAAFVGIAAAIIGGILGITPDSWILEWFRK